MPQSPAITYSDDGTIDYTPGSAVTGKAIVVLNGIVGIAVGDIAANKLGSLTVAGLFKLPKTTAAVVRGLPIHWNPTGSPNSGDASSGAANQLGVGTFAGICAEAAASGVDHAAVNLNQQSNLVGVAAINAAGTSITDAAQLPQGLSVVTGADGTKGVILPVAVPGAIVYVKGVTAGVLKVYPVSGSVINALSASAAISLATGPVPAIFIASTATQWYTIPLVPS